MWVGQYMIADYFASLEHWSIAGTHWIQDMAIGCTRVRVEDSSGADWSWMGCCSPAMIATPAADVYVGPRGSQLVAVALGFQRLLSCKLGSVVL